MADTKDDIIVPTTDWTDVYGAIGVTVGTGLIVQNKDHGLLILRICASKPDAGDTSGFVLDHFKTSEIDAGESGLWAKAIMRDAVVNVQEA